MASKEEQLLAQVTEIIEQSKLDDADKQPLLKLVSVYEKTSKRLDKIIHQSDSMGLEINRQRDRLESLSTKLSKYLSPQIYKMIFANDDEEVKISSKRKKLTIFFSDIVNFTSTTENLESEELTNLLNDYLTRMSDIALEYGATIDKYIGDAIVLFFGDPHSLGYKEDALQCVKMALEMQEQMELIRKEYIGNGIVESFQIRMGINTGYCTVGNFGSANRMDYTIIGGNVNLAARLETAASADEILISHETYSLIKEEISVIKKDKISLKGFEHPIQTYQVEGLIHQPPTHLSQNIKGLSLELDTAKIAHKEEAIAILHDALEKLQR